MTPERPVRPLWLRLLGLFALGLALAVFTWWPFIKAYPTLGGGDGLFFFRLIEAGKVSWSRWHELPLWNPYECGGVPLWDNPQSVVAAPLMLLSQRLDTAATLVVWYVGHAAAGFVCMWIFARGELRLSRLASFVASALWGMGVAHSAQYSGGHVAFAGFVYTPLALYLWRRAEDDARAAVGVGLLFALMFYEGGVYPPPFIGLILAAETLTRVWPPRRALRILRAGATTGAVFFTVAAARLLPVLDQLAHHKRQLAVESDRLDWQLLVDMYLARTHAWRFGHEYVWNEYVAYMGLCVAFALVGIALLRRREAWFLALAAFTFLLMAGHFAAFAPWSILKGHVPPYVSMRVPSRFRLILAMFIGVWVGMAIDRLPRALVRWLGGGAAVRAAGTALVGLAIVATGDVLSVSTDVITTKLDGGKSQPVTPAARLSIGGPHMAQFIDQPRQNRGRLACWEEWAPYAGAPLWEGDVPQARADDARAVLSVKRTQNSFVVDVDAPAPTTIRFNTSFDRGWRADAGAVREDKKELVVDVPAGKRVLRVWYWPHGLTIGFVLTGLGLLVSLGVLVGVGRKREPS